MTAYKLNEEKMFADITDGVAIVINSETGIYYGMNSFGTNVFENLIKGISTERLAEGVKHLSNIPATFDANFADFIKALAEKEIIIEGAESAEMAEINADIAVADNFELTVTEYNDAQELLLADPIHEVKEETGWTPEKDSIGYTKEETAEREKKMKA